MIAGRPAGHSEDRRFKVFSATAVVLVVVGHISSVGFNGPFDLVKPYSFHVAAFAFVSGYFFHLQSPSELIPWLAKKTTSLIIPMYLIYAAYGAIMMLLRFAGFSFGRGTFDAFNLLIAPWIDGHQFPICMPMWFIAPFFLAQVLFAITYLSVKTSLKLGNSSELVTFCLCFGAGACMIQCCGADGLDVGPLLLLCRGLFLLMWVAAGRFYRVYIERYDTCGNGLYFAVCVSSELLMYTALRRSNAYIPSWCEFPDGALVTILATITGIAVLLRFSRVVSPLLPSRRGAIRAIADNSFGIMCHHYFGFFLVKAAFAVIAACTPLFGNFDFSAFLSSSGYVYYPRGLPQFAVVYVISGVMFSLIVHKAYAAIRHHLSTRSA